MLLGEGAEGQATTWEREQEHLKNVADCQEQFGRARLTQCFIPAKGFKPDVRSLTHVHVRVSADPTGHLYETSAL